MSTNVRHVVFYVLLVAVVCSPVWGVQYFLNQDGTAHVYNGYLMTELLKGNPFVSQHLALNPVPLPNATGHWIIVLLLTVFPPFIVTKIVVTGTFALFVAAAAWLRYRTVRVDGLKTSMMIGAVLALNWMWLMGFYNFMIGVTGFVFAVGLYAGWRHNISFLRNVALSLCIIFVYLSHIIAFAALCGTLVVLAVLAPRERRMKNLAWLAAAFLPVVPLLILYNATNVAATGGFSPPHWAVFDPFSFLGWTSQILSANAFILISRRTLPFTDIQSSLAALLSPSLWIVVSLVFLAIATAYKRSKDFLSRSDVFPFAILLVLSLAAAILAPDDFGETNGSVLRPRLMVCSLVFIIPLFRTDTSRFLKRAAQLCLAYVIAFQTLALWEFAVRNDQVAREFLAAAPAIAEHESAAGVMIIDDGTRFHALPETQAVPLLGLGREILVWDDYELGFHVFPIVARQREDREFVYDLTIAHGFILNDPGEIAQFDARLAQLGAALQANHHKIDKLLIWGSDPRVEAVLKKWFDSDSVFQEGRLRVWRHS